MKELKYCYLMKLSQWINAMFLKKLDKMNKHHNKTCNCVLLLLSLSLSMFLDILFAIIYVMAK